MIIEDMLNKIFLETKNGFKYVKEIPDKSIDMILCDPPYGTTDCKWDIIIPFDLMWSHYKRVIKDNGVIAIFGTEPFSSFLRLSNLEMFRYDIIWEKERPTNIFFVKKQIAKVHEVISIFYRKQPTYNPQMTDRTFNTIGVFGKEKRSKTHKNQVYKYSKDYDRTKIYPRSVQRFNRDTLKRSLHPTQKPVKLCEFLIKTYTNEGDIVLDNCMGSGTTAIACKLTNRNFIGMEICQEYIDMAYKRLEKI